MIKRILLSFAVVAAVAVSASALSINVQPGSLQSESPVLIHTHDTELVLTGRANVTDLALLKSMSRSVRKLDMSGLEIVSYQYPSGESYMGQQYFAAGELPKGMLLGSNVSEFIFPNGTKKIGSSAFASSALTSVVVPVTVTEIGNGAWSNCSSLVTAALPEEATLGTGLFKDCTALKTVNLGSSISSIPDSMFDGCSSLTSALPVSVERVGNYSYRGTALAELDLCGVESVGDYAFAEMSHLNSIDMDSNRGTVFGIGAFFGDVALENVPVVGSSVPTLLMAHSSGSSRININAEEVGEAAYANNSALKEVVLGPRVKRVEANAFRNVSNLNLVDVKSLGSEVPEADETAFSGLENEMERYDAHLNVAEGTVDAWKEAPVWQLFEITTGSTGEGAVTQSPLTIEIMRKDGTISFAASDIVEFFGVYSIDGLPLYETAPMSDRCSVEDVDPSHVVIVKVERGNNVKVVKLASSK